MKKFISFVILFISFSFLSQTSFGFNYDISPNEFKKKIASRPSSALSENTHKLLTRSQEDIKGGNFEGGVKILEKLARRTSSKPVEQAQVYQNLGFVYSQKDDQKKAKEYFEKALDLDVLPEAATLSTLYIIGQIYALGGQNKEAEKVLLLWINTAPSPNGQAYAALASVQMELGKKRSALSSIQKAIDLAAEPKESWLQMAVSLYFEGKEFAKAARVLKVLVSTNPSKESYYKQWAASHLSADEEKESLVAMELGAHAGLLKSDSDVKNMTSLMMSTDIPYKAARDMTKKLSKKELSKLKNQKILASAWITARENKKALEVLRGIHKNSPDIKTSIQLGQLLLEDEKWSEAKSVFQKSKTLKPKETDREQVYVGLGISSYNLGDLEASRESFSKVASSSDAAQTWLNFIQSQGETAESL